jgi:hypothetical protein
LTSLADLPLPTVLMAVSIAAVSALHTLIWAVASRNGLLDPSPTDIEWRSTVAAGIAPGRGLPGVDPDRLSDLAGRGEDLVAPARRRQPRRGDVDH